MESSRLHLDHRLVRLRSVDALGLTGFPIPRKVEAPRKAGLRAAISIEPEDDPTFVG